MTNNGFRLTLERRIKYLCRLAVTRQVRKTLLRELKASTFGESLFRAQPRAFYPVMSQLIDRRMGAQARLKSTLASLRAVGALLFDESQDLTTRGITLLELGNDTSVVLSLNYLSFHEGLWQIALTGTGGVRLYSISFGFTDARTVLIGNVQGPSLGHEGLDRIREATRLADGMRPAYLLVHALRLLAPRWGATQLQGIDPDNHIKGRWNLRKSRLRFDYRAFWSELMGVRADAGGNWSLPLSTALRPLEEIPAKRRAMYRRRYAKLQALQHAVARMAEKQDGGAQQM